MKKILFLDIDGVLNTKWYWKEGFTSKHTDKEAVRECYEVFCNTFKVDFVLKNKGQRKGIGNNA